MPIDSCPQANLSELLLGGQIRGGRLNLWKLYSGEQHKSIGGYFQTRLSTPYSPYGFNTSDFISKPVEFNCSIPSNIDLVARDKELESLSNAISTLSNNQLPRVDTWFSVIDWLKDFVVQTNNQYEYMFIDLNPSFSIFTQIALSVTDRILVPVTADGSSIEATLNLFSFVYDADNHNSMYDSFPNGLESKGRKLPKIHLIMKNRLTRYNEGTDGAFSSILETIDNIISYKISSTPNIFIFRNIYDGIVEIRDFQSTGVVSFAEAIPFSKLSTGNHPIGNNPIQINEENLNNLEVIHKV